ncbi:MAG: response regulator [Alphaproteobacteria bacterium]|nr:response regulator [Alphaproteobacteria bacterium]
MSNANSADKSAVILNLLPAAIYWKDENGRFEGCNQAFVKMMGLTSADIIRGKKTEELDTGIGSDTAMLSLANLHSLQHQEDHLLTSGDNETVGMLEKEGATPSARAWLEYRIIGLDKGVMTICRDITKQQQMLSQMKLSNMRAEATAAELNEHLKEANELRDRAQVASQTKSDFLANMSHELRTPINGVYGMCTLLLDSMLDEEQRELTETMHTSVTNLLTLLNDILDISKVEAGDLTLEHVPFDVHVMLGEVRKLFTPVAQKHNLDLIVLAEPGIPACIMGDPARLQQVVQNLVSNALKFTSKGSVSVNVSRDGNSLTVAVTDTGIGIPDDKLGVIFEKFTQADTSVTRKYGGTGLGLAISRELVAMMGGKMQVTSRLGQGSTFSFTLPLEEAAAGTKAVNGMQDVMGHGDLSTLGELDILVVDDHPVNLMFIRKLLQKMGITKIDAAEDGVEAVDKVVGKHYDLVFMDCQMPEMDGYSATRALREKEKSGLQRTTIIAMTANAMVGDREKCITAGMDDYVSKPIALDKLVNVMTRWLPENNVAEHSAMIVTPEVEKDADAPIDLAHLALFTDGNREEEKEIFDMFLRLSEQNLLALRQQCDTGSAEDWKNAAHKFKGAAANLGARRLASYCEHAEQECDGDDIAKLAMVAQIEGELAKVRMFIAGRAA